MYRAVHMYSSRTAGLWSGPHAGEHMAKVGTVSAQVPFQVGTEHDKNTGRVQDLE